MKNVAFWLLLILVCGYASAAPVKYITGYVLTDAGAGVSGVSVAGDNGATSAVTDANGAYSITVSNNWDGTISVSKTGWLITPGSKTYSNVRDDKPNENYTAYQPTISGYARDGAGAGIASATITADNGGGTTTTDAGGYYQLNVPYGWGGSLNASLAGYYFTGKTFSSVTTDQANQDFSGYQPTISGSTGIADATITISGVGSVISTPNYSVVVPYGWSGTVSAELTGYNIPESPKTYTNVTTDTPSQNFTSYQPTISGSTGVAGATVTISGVGSVVSTPNYSVVVPYGWSGTISADKADYNFPESPKTYTNVTTDITGQNFTSYQPTISGYVKKEDLTPLAGVAVSANNGGGSDTTDATGYYEIIIPYNWTGTVSAAIAGYDFTPKTYTTPVVADQTDQNFTGFQPTISGYVKDDGGVGVEGVSISGNNGGGMDTTDAAGYYEIIVPYDWSGTVTPETTGLGFTPAEHIYATLTANQTDQDYTSHALYAGGSGIDVDPYLIYTAEQMQAIGSNPVDWDKHFRLMADLDLSAFDGIDGRSAFNTIGNSTTMFRGVFDGGGNTISGFTYTFVPDQGEITGIGFFRHVSGSQTVIRDVGLINPVIHVSSCNRVGSLAGYVGSGASITNCYAENVDIRADGDVIETGGLIGMGVDSHFSGSHATGTVEGDFSVGGLVGRLGGSVVYDCYAMCDVHSREKWAGGLVGSGSNVGDPGSPVIFRSYASGSISSNYIGAGGLCGAMSGELIDCYASGIVSASAWCGGVVGSNSGYIENCYASTVFSGGSDCGGLVGRNKDTGTIVNSFWDKQVSNVSNMCFSEFSNSCDDTMGKTTSQMQMPGTFSSVGWDIANTWAICDGYDYPYLRWEGYPPCIDISNNTLTFSTISKEINPDDQTFTIVNSCAGTLNWNIDKPAECDWLNVSPLSNNSNPDVNEVTVSIDISGLDYGLHSCQLTVSDTDATNSPQVVTVNLEVLRPELTVTTSGSFDLLVVNGSGVQAQTVSIQNTGYDSLNWQITEIPQADWLSADPNTGTSTGEVDDVIISIDPNGLANGLYTCQLQVSDPLADNSPQVIDVSLRVYTPGVYRFPSEFDDLQEAVDFAQNGDTIIIEPGVHGEPGSKSERIEIYDKNLTIRSENPEDPNSPQTTVLRRYSLSFENYDQTPEGRASVKGIMFQECFEGVSAYNTPITISNCVFDSCRETAIYLFGEFGGQDVIEDCVITNTVNEDRNCGWPGAIRNYSRSVSIRNCVISDNEIPGIANEPLMGANNIEIIGCQINHNGGLVTFYLFGPAEIFYAHGGGVNNSGGNLTILDSEFIGNVGGFGGAIFSDGVEGTFNTYIANTLIAGNRSIQPVTVPYPYEVIGGGIFAGMMNLVVDNCTIVGNKGNYGAGIGLAGNTKAVVTNSIVYGNISEVDGEQIGFAPPESPENEHYRGPGDVTVMYSDVEGSEPNYICPECEVEYGAGNIDVDPLFVDAGYWDPNGTGFTTNDDFWVNGDYHLKSQAGRWALGVNKPSDFNGDSIVNFADFAVVSSQWLMTGAGLAADLNSDNSVDVLDAAIFAGKFLGEGDGGGYVYDQVTSECIDAGNPVTGLGNEPDDLNNIRVNMGAYGGTGQASRTPAGWWEYLDLNNDFAADAGDVGALCMYWLRTSDDILPTDAGNPLPYDFDVPGDFDGSGQVDLVDFAIFADYWLSE